MLCFAIYILILYFPFFLVNDKRSNMKKNLSNILVYFGLHTKGEDLDGDSAKVKITFAIVQFIYVLITFLPVPLLYRSYSLSFAYLVIVFSWGTWNGASFYIEVFAQRYRLKFVEAEDQ